MTGKHINDNPHFTVELLASGVYACIHKPGGAAYSNSGIIDLGDSTLVVDAHEFLVAGKALRQTAEGLFSRPVKTLVITHAHNDHWIGASAFDAGTMVIATEKVRKIVAAEGPGILEDIQTSGYWENQIKAAEEQLLKEKVKRVLAGLRNQITHYRFGLAEKDEYQPRSIDQVFSGSMIIQGSSRMVEVRAMGWGHSQGDAVVLLPEDKIAFLGDIGFFATQPFMAYCHLEEYRKQIQFFLEPDYELLVPGHGPVGGKKDLVMQMEYFDAMENLVGDMVKRGGSLDDALHIILPEKFQPWLLGGIKRFESNVRYLYKQIVDTEGKV
jgi:glyoxylase-like metal-dependent hydrolase (beta-lactamase superfamily II)